MERQIVVNRVVETAGLLTRRLDGALSSIKGITFSEYQLLSAIDAEGDASATRVLLAQRVGLTPSGVTRALKPLEKLGYVDTVRDSRDARRSIAKLTSAGRDLVADASGVVDDTLEGLETLGALSEGEETMLMRILGALAV